MGETVPSHDDARGKFIEHLGTYQDRLLQVDWRNRSILLKKTHKRWSFDVAVLLQSRPGVVEDCITKALRGKGGICLVRDTDITGDAEGHRSSLVQIERSSRLIFEESGLQDTYLGFPFLEGHLDREHFVRAPVVLFPVKLEHQRRERIPGWYALFSEDSGPVLNRALFAALRKVGGIALPDDFSERLEGILEHESVEEGIPAAAFLQQLLDALLEISFPLAVNQTLETNARALQPLSTEELQALPQTALHVVPYAVIGSFPQGSTAIFQDYERLIQRAGEGEHDQGVIDDLLESRSVSSPPPQPEHGGEIDAVPDSQLNFALPSDGSQDSVILEAQRAECVVVRGPPGTGKSQVIVNLITNALAKGERVMVVCQKRAALDVVHQRLDRAGLADSVVLLHDARVDRSAVYARLARRLQEANPVEDPRLEQEFQRLSSDIDRAIGEINTIVHPLNQEFYGGIRLRELYAAAQPGYKPRLRLPIKAGDLTHPELPKLLDKLSLLETGYRKFDEQGMSLSGRLSFANLEAGSRDEIIETLSNIERLSDTECQVLQDLEAQRGLVHALAAYRRFRDSPVKFLRPTWWSAKRAVEEYAHARSFDLATEGLVELHRKVRAGYDLLSAITELSHWFSQECVTQFVRLAAQPEDLRSHLRKTLEALEKFDEIQEHDRHIAALSPVERAIFRAVAEGLSEQADSWSPIVKQEILSLWISAVESAYPQLRGDPFGRYTSLRNRFKEQIERRRLLFVKRLETELRRQSSVPVLPPGPHHHRRNPETDWNKLLYEFNKRRRIKPVRKVMEEFPFQFLRIAPCWLVSPEACSDVFPLQRSLVDLLIFDEASQLAVERALPAMYRAKRVVIAGDEKQLRPFDLFQIRGEGDDDVDEIIEAESLLVLAMRVFTPRYLSWHYRSIYQELIDFSNHAFYDGFLQIAPNTQKAMDDAPIEFVQCDGIWEDRTNLVEAEKVIDTVASILSLGEERGQSPSVGVITFNDAQRDLILDRIEARRNSDAMFDRLYTLSTAEQRTLDDRPFVKNIENVQGDERDIILFSVAYAPDRDGRLRAQFGSLNLEGGENRLNVAVTRARQKIIMVTSFDPAELPVEGTKNPGPKRLRDYLLYAKLVSGMRRPEVERLLAELNPGVRARPSGTPLLFESPLEQQVYEALRQRGFDVDTQVGFSGYRLDLAVVHPKDPSRYIIGIECDGAMFHSARSARERDVARQRFLESRGWNVERIWSRNWWRSPKSELDRIQDRVTVLARGGASSGRRPGG